MVLSVSHGKLFAVALLCLPGRAAEGTTLTRASPLQSAASGAHCRATELSVQRAVSGHISWSYTVYIRQDGLQAYDTSSSRATDVAGLVEGALSRTAINQTITGLGGSLLAFSKAALSQPALALEAVPNLVPQAMTSIWSLVASALKEAAKPPPVVRSSGDAWETFGAPQKHVCLSDVKGSARDVDSYAGVLQSTLPGLHRCTFLSDLKPCELVWGRHWVMLSWRC